jgi:hypothetical protein
MLSSIPATRSAKRLLPLLATALLVAILLVPAAAQAETTSSTASPTSTTGQTGVSPTTSTSAPSTQVTQPQQGAIVPPPAGQTPLNPGWKTDQIGIRVWPEYDKKAVLVIMNLTLPAEVPLPATLRFAVPAGATIAGIGEIDPNGEFTYNYGEDYPPVEPGAEWDIATIEVKSYRKLQIDYYYDPGLPQGAGQRSFPLLAQMPLDVGALLLHVQHPAGATDFAIQPPLDATGQSDDGFTYSVGSYTDVESGSTLGHTVSYYKPDGSLSVDAANPSEPGTTQVNTTTVLLAAILVVVVIVGGVVLYYLFVSKSRSGGPRGNGRGDRRRQERTASATGAKQQRWDDKAQKFTKAEATAQKKSAAKGATAKAPSAAKTSAADAGPTAAAEADDAPAAAATAAAAPLGDASATQAGETAEYCVACGEELTTKSRFCPNCGEARS